MPINTKTIGEWIRISRTQKNLTPGHVAAKMGIAHSLICSLEAGVTEPDKLQLASLEKILDCKPPFSGD